MAASRMLWAASLLLLLCSLPVLGQQLPKRGSLAELGNFKMIINLADSKAAKSAIHEALVDPGLQFESVTIHAYAASEVCQEVSFWRRIANDYGALVLTSGDSGSIEGGWFDRFDNACDSIGSTDNWKQGFHDDALLIADQMFKAAVDDQNGRNENLFVYMTAPLPYAESQVELWGRCNLSEELYQDTSTACYHNLSRSFVPAHRTLLDSLRSQKGESGRQAGNGHNF